MFFFVVVVEANSSQITLTIIALGGIEGEIPRRHPSSSSVYIVKYLQSKYTVNKPEKISLCSIRGRMESLCSDDVSIVYARK